MRPAAVISILLCAASLLTVGCAATPAWKQPLRASSVDHAYLDLISTYCIYAKSIWHVEGDDSGYWGEGVDPKANQNGAIRATCNALNAYATLVVAMDNQWLDADLTRRLQSSGLDRAALLDYIVKDARYLCAHHQSATTPREPTWGSSWQSTMWLGVLGIGALEVWNDLPADVRESLQRVAAVEADRIVEKPPKDYKPGDTGAEENAWDAHAPAVALAMDPQNPHAAQWLDAVKKYAVNVYSVRADKGQPFVSTANLFDDFTLENHGFFHPDYVQVSGQHLGETWLIFQLADRIHHTNTADEIKPFVQHHAADVWYGVAKPLVLSNGEFAFPAGTDWTVNCGMTPSYLAFAATALDDGFALAAAREQVKNAQLRRDASPGGRIFGDSNMEWWWESLLAARLSTALMQYAVRGEPYVRSIDAIGPHYRGSGLYPDAKVWIHHGFSQLVSVSWGSKILATWTPTWGRFSTLPIDGGILPDGVVGLEHHSEPGPIEWIALKLKDGRRCVVISTERSVLFLSPAPPHAIGIENDSLTKSRRLVSIEDDQKITALSGGKSRGIAGFWLNVDDQFSFATGRTEGFRYQPAGKFNRRSAAIDLLSPGAKSWCAWQMFAASAGETAKVAGDLQADFDGTVATITMRDGPGGKLYRITATLSGPVEKPEKIANIQRQ